MTTEQLSARCPACDSTLVTPLELITTAESVSKYALREPGVVARLADEAQRVASAYELLVCDRCGLEFASPAVAPAEDWYRLLYGALDLYAESRWEFQYCLAALGPDDRVLEFGCGSGAFLALCQKRGVVAVGVDFSESAVGQCRARGLEAVRVDLSRPRHPSIPPVTDLAAFHVLEHLEAPSRIFELARALGTESARLWVSVPSPRRATRELRLVDELDRPPHHLTRWTSRALREIGFRTGWRLDDVVFEPVQLRSAVWAITTASCVYQRMPTGLRSCRFVERPLRWALYPLSLWRYLRRYSSMTGFSMLARFSPAERGDL